MPTVGVAIMAHPKRESMAVELFHKVGRLGDVVVVWDTNNVEWDTGRRCWLEGADSGFTHWMVLQDDIIPSQDLIPGVERALEYIPPYAPLSLYVGRVLPYAEQVTALAHAANMRSASFITTNKLNWGLANVVPTVQIPAMIDYCDKRGERRYDNCLSKWFEFNGVDVYNTWPSLVDHRNTASLLGNKRGNRVAHRFLGAEESALDVDWSGPVVHTVSKHQP